MNQKSSSEAPQTRNRASVARHTGPLIEDLKERASIEARNALLQFDEVLRLAPLRFGDLRLTPDDVCRLQSIAVKDIFEERGVFRAGPIEISNTPHEPPPADQVPQLVTEMCEYANKAQRDPIHTSAYLMWRHNWIHPFSDGNGRTSRAISYLALCSGFSMVIPGNVTVPDMIAGNKSPYYDALDAADASWKASGTVDVSKMEKLIGDLLARQLESDQA